MDQKTAQLIVRDVQNALAKVKNYPYGQIRQAHKMLGRDLDHGVGCLFKQCDVLSDLDVKTATEFDKVFALFHNYSLDVETLTKILEMKEVKALVGVMEVTVGAGEDGRLGTEDDTTSIRRATDPKVREYL